LAEGREIVAPNETGRVNPTLHNQGYDCSLV
jgi:hypothetical protein